MITTDDIKRSERFKASLKGGVKPAGSESGLNDGLYLYSLFNKDGKMVKSSLSLDETTNHFPEDEYSVDMRNNLFSEDDPEKRQKIFEENGWRIKRGKFVEV